MQEPSRFSVWRTLKLGLFHVGSAFADVLGSAIWNRLLISNMGIAATPVALLLALRNLVVPLTLWVGHLSDTHPLFGRYRLPYIWIGRGMMLLSMPLLPASTLLIGQNTGSLAGWALALVSFLMYGVGTQISGSPFLALVRESAPRSKQGLAYAIVQTILVAGFAFSPAIYSALAYRFIPNIDPASSGLRQYNLELFTIATGMGMVIALISWFFSVLGEEPRRAKPAPASENHQAEFGSVLRAILRDPRARMFFLFLSIGAMSGFAQDAILEPFAADIFGLTPRQTTGLTSYWGTGLLIGLIGAIAITRKWPTVEQVRTTQLGLVLSALPLFGLGVCAFTGNQSLLIPALTLFGLGFGIYTAGGSPLLMVMSLDKRAGAYLGLWSMAQLLSRGVGIFLGGLLRDVMLAVTGSQFVAYGSIFTLEAIGFLTCILLLRAADVRGFAHRAEHISPVVALGMAD